MSMTSNNSQILRVKNRFKCDNVRGWTRGDAHGVCYLLSGSGVGGAEAFADVVDDVADALLSLDGADQEGVVGVGHDVVLKPPYRNHLVAFGGHDAVLAVVEQGAAVLGDVTFLVFR